MAQDTIDKIINIQFKYSDLVNGWAEASKAIDSANAKLKEFKKEGNAEGVAKQTQLIKALRAEMSQYTREIQANVREEVKAEGSINQLNAKIAKLTAQYNAMSGAVRKSSVGEALAKEIAEVQTEVNKANEAVLNFRNTVGHYARAAEGFGPLNMQVQQIARELPSLTVSLSQFFLAISNNWPMFVDEINRAKEANKALKAEGKATVPVFKQVVSAIFSWQTALVVGITLLTAYGKEIANWVKGLFSAKEASITMEEAARNVNKAIEEGGYGIGEQIAKVKSLQTAWNNLGDDLDARKKFITDNKDAFDELGVKVTDVNDAENLLVRNTDAFIESLKARAQAAAGMKLAAEAYEKALIEEQKVAEEIKKGYVKVFTNEELTTIQRPYTEAEKEALMEPVRALEAQAEAYINLSTEKQKAAKETLELAGIEEKTNKDREESVRQLMTLEQIQYKMQLKNTAEYTKAISKQQQEWAKLANKMEADIEKELARTDKEIGSAFKNDVEQWEKEYRNRIASAKANAGGGESGQIAAAREMIAIYKEQLDDLDKLEGIFNGAGETDLDIQSRRIEARQRVADAEQAIARAEEMSTQKSFQSAQQLLGALGSLAEATEENSALAAMFAIAQSVAAMGEALRKAFSTSATVWDGIAGAVAAITTITTIVSQIKSLNSSASSEASKYASGGLVTGPGTGTSDSIPAMLSNGEAVMTAAAVNEWGAMLSAMNVSSGGNAINVSNLPQRGDGMRGMERMMERVMMNMPSPVVSVVDINKGQRKVQVQDNISKLGRKKYT